MWIFKNIFISIFVGLISPSIISSEEISESTAKFMIDFISESDLDHVVIIKEKYGKTIKTKLFISYFFPRQKRHWNLKEND